MKIFRKALSTATASIMAVSMCAIDIGNLAPVSYAADLTAVQLVEDMGQGWNLGNTFDSSNTWKSSYSSEPLTPTDIETAWGNPVTTEAMIKEIKKSGFKTVRIPINWYQMMSDDGTSINADWIARIKEVIEYCLNNDMYAIINAHHDEDWIEKESNTTKYSNMWTSISKAFAEYDQRLIFEGTNECEFNSTSDQMKFNQAFVDTVRATGGNNTNRLLLVPANNNNTDEAIKNLSAPSDPSKMVAVSVHYYEPTAFCVAQDPTNQWWYQSTWGTSADITKVENDLDKLQSKFIDNGVPVIIGEYGVVNKALAKKDDASSKKFLKEVATYALSKDGMCPIVWDMSVQGDVGTEKEGDMYYFNRNTLSWYDDEIKQIFAEAGAGSSTVDTNKTDRVTFTAEQIGTVDSKTGKTSLQVNLKPYKEFGVNVTSAIVKFKMTAEGSDEASGDIAISFNVNTESGDLKYSNIDTSVGINDTTVTVDLTPETFNTAWDSDGKITETSKGTIDMDYLKFENWWTWANNGDASLQIESVTVLFDGKVSADTVVEPQVTTVTTTEKKEETTTTTVSDNKEDVTYTGVYANAYLAGSIGANSQWNVSDAAANGTVAQVDGNGTFEAEWKLAEGSSTIDFLMLEIESIADFDSYFTTDTFPDLSLTIDRLYIDGNEVTLSDNASKAINLRYFEGTGKTRAYFRTNWGANSGEDFGVSGDTEVLESVKVVFTVGGTYQESDSNPSEEDVIAGDANGDGKVTLADCVAILQYITNSEKYPLTEAQKKAADVDGAAGITGKDALTIQNYDSGKITELPVKS